MKKVYLAIIVISCFLVSCSKEDSIVVDTNYHLSCSIDGVAMTFNVNSGAVEINDNGNWLLGMGGINADSANAATLAIGVYATQPGMKVPAGSYTDNGTSFQLISTFSDVYNQVDYNAGQEIYDIAQDAGATIANHLQVQVTELTDKIVRGKLSGDYYEASEIEGSIKRITNGEFYLLIQQ